MEIYIVSGALQAAKHDVSEIIHETTLCTFMFGSGFHRPRSFTRATVDGVDINCVNNGRPNCTLAKSEEAIADIYL